jgi:hypothetical protein
MEGFHVTGSKDLTRGFTPSGALVKAIMINSGQPLRYQDASGIFQEADTMPIPNRRYIIV